MKKLWISLFVGHRKIIYKSSYSVVFYILESHRFAYFTLILELFETESPFVISSSLTKGFTGLNSSFSTGDFQTSSSIYLTLAQLLTFFFNANKFMSSSILGSHSSVISITILLISYKISLSWMRKVFLNLTGIQLTYRQSASKL